jgi:hypothetical protein
VGERLSLNQDVMGSNPITGAKKASGPGKFPRNFPLKGRLPIKIKPLIKSQLWRVLQKYLSKRSNNQRLFILGKIFLWGREFFYGVCDPKFIRDGITDA